MNECYIPSAEDVHNKWQLLYHHHAFVFENKKPSSLGVGEIDIYDTLVMAQLFLFSV